MAQILLILSMLSCLIWLILIFFWGRFWCADQKLSLDSLSEATSKINFPSVCAVIPARNEAELLPITLKSLLLQKYSGSFSIILVNDQSSDGTAEIGQQIVQNLNVSHFFHLIHSQPLPIGWTGKLWAIQQGIEQAIAQLKPPDYFLLTDADIEHYPHNLHQLVSQAERENLDLVSLMVLLKCQSFWEKLLIPAFVFFFQKLYPFRWVNNPQNRTAAAAGGCILIRRQALEEIGGVQAVRQALIDDCALAEAVKLRPSKTSYNSAPLPSILKSRSRPFYFGKRRESYHKIWLGLTDNTRSLRDYPSLKSIWQMVARTAFTQLNYSPLLLLGTLIGMVLVYLVAPIGLIGGIFIGNKWLILISAFTWALMLIAYFPTLRLYQCSLLWAFSLPIIAFLYLLMTLDSALQYWQGKGGAWKGRTYPSN